MKGRIMTLRTISLDLYWELSDILFKGTRELNEEKSWEEWSSSGWRMMSNEILQEVLDKLRIEVEK